MTISDPRERVLCALLLQSQSNEKIDLFSLVEEAYLGPYAVLKALAALDDAGLVDAGRLRLTMQGLTVATALCPAARRIAETEPELPSCVRAVA